MRCSEIRTIIEETPQRRWSASQSISIVEHCSDCVICKALFEEQSGLFELFEKLESPLPQQPLDLAFINRSSSEKIQVRLQMWPSIALALACVGSCMLLLLGEGITLHWLADGQRLSTVASALTTMPVLSMITIMSATIYCFSKPNNSNTEIIT